MNFADRSRSEQKFSDLNTHRLLPIFRSEGSEPGWTPQARLTWRPKGDKPEKKHLWVACKERNPALKENQLRDKQAVVDWLSLNSAPSDADRSGKASVFVMETALGGIFFTPPLSGGLDLDSRNSGCARQGGEVGPLSG